MTADPARELHPKRRCACTEHTGREPWHGTPRGYDSHACRCARCRYAHAHPVFAARLNASAASHRRRRARLAAVPHEPYDDLAIAERDNWLCAGCGEPIDPATHRPAGPIH